LFLQYLEIAPSGRITQYGTAGDAVDLSSKSRTAAFKEMASQFLLEDRQLPSSSSALKQQYQSRFWTLPSPEFSGREAVAMRAHLSKYFAPILGKRPGYNDKTKAPDFFPWLPDSDPPQRIWGPLGDMSTVLRAAAFVSCMQQASLRSLYEYFFNIQQTSLRIEHIIRQRLQRELHENEPEPAFFPQVRSESVWSKFASRRLSLVQRGV
jgi:hypothetical protein